MHNHQSLTLLVYGGSGYVGSKVIELAAGQGARCISVSREGCPPAHLLEANPPWLENVQWVADDAAMPDSELIDRADVVICLVGSPPVPTFSQASFAQQLRMNGACSSQPIQLAGQKGVSRVVLMSAHIPSLLCSKRFAYFLGKQQALKAARLYASESSGNSVSVLRPSAIYGTRHTRSGMPIPLGLLMAPIAWLMRYLPRPLVSLMPESPVSLDKVANAIVNESLGKTRPGLHVIENQQLLGL